MTRLQIVWIELRSALWFLPSLIVLGAVLLALALIAVDSGLDRDLFEDFPLLFGAGSDGSRGMLEVIAASMITVAGVVFSITIVALSLASNQYSPQVLRNFMRDRTNQTVLGVFLGIFSYCLVVLRSIRSSNGDDERFIPSLAVLTAIVLAFVGIGFLIHFIHHIVSLIQAARILADINEDTNHAIDHLFPKGLGKEEDEDQALPPDMDQVHWTVVLAQRTGYIEGVDNQALLALARDCKTVLRMERGIGEFVAQGTPLASLARQVDEMEDVAKRLHKAFVCNRQRTIEQDAAFGIRQIVDVALKALSPSLNDTSTAVMCVHYLGALLIRLADRRVESPYRFEDGELRVIARGPNFVSLLDEALDEIRQNAGGNVTVLHRLLQALEFLAAAVDHPRRREALRRHVDAIAEVVQRTIPAPYDRTGLELLISRLRLTLTPE